MTSKPPAEPSESPDPGSAALRALIRNARGSFGKPLRVERSQGRLSVMLEGELGGASAAAITSADAQARLMRHDLKAELDRYSNSRKGLPFLALLEQGLERRGLRAFDEIPLPALRRAAAQLQGLAQEPLLEGLALLQARLDVAIVGREEALPVVCKPNALSSFFVDHKLEVREVSMSDFLTVAGPPPTVPGELFDSPR
ncbi:MAG: hypothetical protein AD742_05595 [Methylibium sp. NZG]|nr:MAG: hypothetical protein AD742_05595 [Methylibium sp. NZG]